MIPDKWIQEYLKKSGDTSFPKTQYAHHCEHGFATWNINENYLVIMQMYGKGDFWRDFFIPMAQKLNLIITFGTRRNPKAWERSFNAKLVGYIMEVDPWET